ncbi:MAG: Alpha-L-rhamnosidase N-terminal domain [Acidobacteriota bacterium]|nr:Alpha-L-rhamnosidase N-terminal domain [Acidobacteriota bacterium]
MLHLLRSPAFRRTALWVLAVFALALGTRAVRAVRARGSLPTGSAEWIWTPLARNESSPVAFCLVRDFDLDPPPVHGRLLVAADEEYVLYLNGRRIGSGRYSAAAAGRRGTLLDSYEVGDELTPGGNRLLAEVRSGRGTGGFLLALVEGLSGRPLLGTDLRWRVYRRDHPFLLRGLVPLSPKLILGTGEDVSSWGLPPMGRWGVPAAGPGRPLFADLVGDRAPLTARRTVLSDPPAPGLPPVPRTLFDFGRLVTGYLHLEVKPDEVQRAGLLYTRVEGVPEISAVRPDGAVITIPARHGWEDACPRRFRYALVVGLDPIAARVQPVDEGAAAALLAPAAPTPLASRPAGVLGLVPPPLRTPVENEVWREFQRVPGVAGREDL